MADTDKIGSDCGGRDSGNVNDAVRHRHGIHRSQMSETSFMSSSSTPSSSGPMRQLEFNQAMNDFQNMFPGMDTEVIEAVLRANNGIVDATIDQLLTMSIDNDDDDLPDHILMSVQREVALEARNQEVNKTTVSHLDDSSLEESPPPYTEAIKSSHVMSRSSNGHSRHGQHHHANRRPLRASPTQSSPRHHLHKPRSPTPVDLDLDSDFMTSTESNQLSSSWDTSSSPKCLVFPDHTDSGRPIQGRTETQHGGAGQKKDVFGGVTARGQHSAVKSCGRQFSSPACASAQESVASSRKVHPQSHRVSWNASSVPVRSKSFGVSDCKGSSESRHQLGNSRHKSATRGSPAKLPPYHNWNPPMLGTLPDDFLRLTPCVPDRIPLKGQRSDIDHRRTVSSSMDRSQSGGEESCDLLKTRRSHQSRMPQRSLSFAGASKHSYNRITSEDLSSEFIQRKMKENERRRRLASADLDPELAQYLEDERLALILQNSEFLRELRDDEDFMQTLEKDRQTSVVETVPPVESISQQVPSSLMPHSGSEVIAGYGNDHQSTLEAFPFSQQLPKADEADAEFLQKLRHMGKASKKQFAALARRFFSRKRKKSPRHLLRETLAPSMTNLLDDEEEDDGIEDGPETSQDIASNSDPEHCGYHADSLHPR